MSGQRTRVRCLREHLSQLYYQHARELAHHG
jgi:hypothetical protein